KFISLEKENLQSLLSDLKAILVKSSTTQIAEELEEKHEFTKDEIEEFISAMILLSTIKNDLKSNYEEVLDEVIKKGFKRFKDNYNLEESKIDDFIVEIKKVLSSENFSIQSKISRLKIDIPNKILSSTIYSDSRYVFSEDPTEIPTHSVINHSLKLTFRDANRINELYFGLDGEELINLKNIVDRAIKKDKTLRLLCKQNKIRVVNDDLDDGC
ncbi:MAG: hypothetical protein ACTSYI_17050, partial [Promethearchaeota archaeon]